MGKFKVEVRKMVEEDPIEIIKKLGKLSELDVEKFSKEGGYADKYAKGIDIDTTQLRKFFEAVREIDRVLKLEKNWSKVREKFYLLYPYLAYARGRGLISKDFYELMKTCMDKIDIGTTNEEKIKNFVRFVQFFEAIVAYHRFYRPRRG
jgi:CRISPR-associated protein Csm2